MDCPLDKYTVATSPMSVSASSKSIWPLLKLASSLSSRLMVCARHCRATSSIKAASGTRACPNPSMPKVRSEAS